jgi:outer membrane protein assembly factor BamB
MRHALWISSAVAAWGLLTGGTAGGDWPRFRGPNGTGVASDKDVPVRWTAENVLWKTPIPGQGHSSPVVCASRVFLQSATSKARLLLCLDAATGKVLWTKTWTGRVAHTHPRNTLASSTPACDGSRIYAVWWDGSRVTLSALTLDGKPAWQADLGSFKSQHGPGFSPMTHAGRVYINNDQDGSAVLLAFDAKTGSKLWQKTRRAFRACYSTPFVRKGTDGEELVVASTAGLTAYDPADGAVRWDFAWRFSGKPLRTVASPVEADGLIFAAAGDGDGSRAMIGVRPPGKGDGAKATLAWEKDSGTPYVPTLLARRGHLYAVRDDGIAVCWEAKSGKEVWKSRLGEPASASPVLIGDNVFAPDERGDVHVFAASQKGLTRLAKNSLGEPVFSTPAAAGNRLYLRGRGHMFCVGKPAK